MLSEDLHAIKQQNKRIIIMFTLNNFHSMLLSPHLLPVLLPLKLQLHFAFFFCCCKKKDGEQQKTEKIKEMESDKNKK